jgi:hypothetical protein
LFKSPKNEFFSPIIWLSYPSPKLFKKPKESSLTTVLFWDTVYVFIFVIIGYFVGFDNIFAFDADVALVIFWGLILIFFDVFLLMLVFGMFFPLMNWNIFLFCELIWANTSDGLAYVYVTKISGINANNFINKFNPKFRISLNCFPDFRWLKFSVDLKLFKY